MKRTFTLIAACLVAASSAVAMGDADANADGVLTLDEVKAAYPDVSEDQFMEADANDDGLLTAGEVSDAIAAGILPSG